jgi:hypothetical protein
LDEAGKPFPIPLAGYMGAQSECNFSKFVYFLRMALDAGVTFDVTAPQGKDKKSSDTTMVMTTNKDGSVTATTTLPISSSSGSGSNATTNASSGAICFDPGLVNSFSAKASDYNLNATNNNRCGDPATQPDTATFLFRYTSDASQTVSVHLKLRSPFGIYAYFGQLLRMEEQGIPTGIAYYGHDSGALLRQTFFEVGESGAEGDGPCLAATAYLGRSYCVPDSAYGTGVDIAILEDLRNLSITPIDLNSPLSVHVTP